MFVRAVLMAVVVAVIMIVIAVTDLQGMRSGRQRVGAGPFERIFRLEDFRIELRRAVEVEAAYVEHVVERHVAVFGAVHLGHPVDTFDPRLEGFEVCRVQEIGLVQQDHVRETDLLHRLVVFFEVLRDVFRVDDRDDRIEPEVLLHLVVSEKRLRNGRRIREAGSLDENPVQLVLAFEQATKNADEITAHAAADAAVVHLEEFLLALDHELVIDAHFAKFVFDHREFLAVVFGKNAIEERRFTGAEKTSENSDRDHQKNE